MIAMVVVHTKAKNKAYAPPVAPGKAAVAEQPFYRIPALLYRQYQKY